MPSVPGRAQRLLLSFALGTGLAAAPALASADPVVRFSEHAVNLFCDAQGEEGELHLFVGVSSEFGSFAELVAWAAPVDPAAAPDIEGSTETVVVVEANGGATLSATIPVVDGDGVAVGNAIVSAVLTPTGDVEVLEPFRDGNRTVKTTGTIAFMDVSGMLDLPGDLPDFTLADLGCGGEIVDIDVFETEPHTFVIDNDGIFVDCFWETADGVASFFAVDDDFGPFAEAFLMTADQRLVTVDVATVALDAASLGVTIPMFDVVSEELASATASATLSPFGDPVTSIFLSQNGRNRVTEQRLVPDGTLAFSTGDEFTMDADSCFAAMFEVHAINSAPQGPKPGGAAPANDTPDGAVALRFGGVLNVQTGGTAVDPELQVTACPEEDDRFGHTLWYTFTGTGGPVTIDTAGSNFDTVLAVYDDGLTLLACNDDVGFEPIGGSFQAALTVDTVEGATYYVQAGGFDSGAFFGEPNPEFGRLRIRIS